MRYAEIVHRMREAVTARPFNRRTFVLGGAVAGTLAARPLFAQTPNAPLATPVFGEDPFTLGVASGEPLPDGVVLWTRLAPRPLEAGYGMPHQPVVVRWQVARDEAMTQVVQAGETLAEPAWGHAVHVEVTGLDPGRPYWYRFTSGAEESVVGRTRTAPAPGSAVGEMRFAFASCQRWDHGLYTAYRDMVAQEPDLVVHLGDYIYETAIGFGHQLRDIEVPGPIGFTPNDLESYRFRHALYRLDPHLQEAHRIAPWLVTWDDHEVDNNYFGEMLRDLPAAQGLLALRAAAYQAWYEHMPVRRESLPQGPDLQLFRSRTFGGLLDFNLLDTRQYRTSQGSSCNDDLRAEGDGFCPDSLDPGRTLLGERQRDWLLERFTQGEARWMVLAQQVPFARIDNDSAPEVRSFGGLEMDKWDGYAWERDVVATAMTDAAGARGFAPVVITGDVHANHVWDLKRDWDDPSDETVYGTEFVGTSISSGGDDPLVEDGGFTTECGQRNGNPHNHLFDNHRGYVLCWVTPDQWQTTYRAMPNVSDPAAEGFTLASFVVEHQQPGVQADARCTPVVPA
jgi:alkaline phosphatase D